MTAMEKLRMHEKKGNGYLITFCGLDGCGKSTMLRRTIGELEGIHPLSVTKEPTDAVRRSDIFRTYMDSPEHGMYEYRSLSLLAASDRVQHSAQCVEKAILRGETVLSDRYFYSCLANLRARGFRHDKWIYEISEFVVKPDVAFFFDVPVEVAVGRVRSRPEEKNRYIDMELQYALRNEYRDICKENGGVLIETDGDEDECFERVRSALIGKGIL